LNSVFVLILVMHSVPGIQVALNGLVRSSDSLASSYALNYKLKRITRASTAKNGFVVLYNRLYNIKVNLNA
jgi:hypothetical protein